MGGCCTANEKVKNSKNKAAKDGISIEDRKDTMQQMQIQLRKKVMKRDPVKINEILYMKPEECLRWISSRSNQNQHKNFIKLLEDNKFTLLYQLTGFDECFVEDGFERDSTDNNLEPFLTLKSGRMVDSTQSWNPVVFGFVFDHVALVDYVKKNSSEIDLVRCMQVDPLIKVDGQDWDSSKQRFRNFLTLLVENQSASLFKLLDAFYFLIDYEDLVFIFSILPNLQSDDRLLMLKDVMDSQAFKSIYME